MIVIRERGDIFRRKPRRGRQAALALAVVAATSAGVAVVTADEGTEIAPASVVIADAA